MSYEIVVVKTEGHDRDERLARIDELLNEGYRVAFVFPMVYPHTDHAVYLHKPPVSPVRDALSDHKYFGTLPETTPDEYTLTDEEIISGLNKANKQTP